MSPPSRSRLIQQTNVPISNRRTKKSLAQWAQVMSLTAGGSPTTPTWVRLSCPVPHQQKTEWCWCATTLGIHKYHDPVDATSQCQAANHILTRTDACTNPGGADVNKPYFLDKALAAYGHLRSPIQRAPLPAAQLELEIRANAPVGARIGWSDGKSGHFMAIVGFLNSAVPRVAVEDPSFGPSDIDYALYLTAYQGAGRWTHFYLTQ